MGEHKIYTVDSMTKPPNPHPFFFSFSGGGGGEIFRNEILCCSETYERPPLVEAGKSSFSKGLNVWSHVRLVQEENN